MGRSRMGKGGRSGRKTEGGREEGRAEEDEEGRRVPEGGGEGGRAEEYEEDWRVPDGGEEIGEPRTMKKAGGCRTEAEKTAGGRTAQYEEGRAK